MGAGEAIAVATMLVIVAGATAGLWLNLLMWLPLLALEWMVLDSFVMVQWLGMIVAAAAVASFGVFVLGLPIVAGLAAGSLVGITSYVRPSAAY